MGQVDTMHLGRYWSEGFCSTIMTHLSDLEFKVKDLEILCQSCCLKCFELYIAGTDGCLLPPIFGIWVMFVFMFHKTGA